MLKRNQKYLQIALNNTLEEARLIINQIPVDERILIEVGTPLIKNYGIKAIRQIKQWWETKIFSKSFHLLPYVIADLKCMDRAAREVQMAKEGGATAAVVLGQAPLETINNFIEECEKEGLSSMVDMMNVDYSLEILRRLKKLPKVVILHRGVDEENFNRDSEIPYYEITRIKSEYDVIVAIAGGETIQEVQKAILNDADVVVLWKAFYQSEAKMTELVKEFLKEIK